MVNSTVGRHSFTTIVMVSLCIGFSGDILPEAIFLFTDVS